METFAEYLAGIEDEAQRERLGEVLTWVAENYPQLATRIGWNQPMFTLDGTFIVGFSIYPKNLSITPEVAGIDHFKDEIVKRGYTHTQGLWRVPWDMPLDYELLARMIEFQIAEKAGYEKFWR